MHCIVWDDITYPLPNLDGTTFEVWELISNCIPHFYCIWFRIHVGLELNYVSKRGPWRHPDNHVKDKLVSTHSQSKHDIAYGVNIVWCSNKLRLSGYMNRDMLNHDDRLKMFASGDMPILYQEKIIIRRGGKVANPYQRRTNNKFCIMPANIVQILSRARGH